MKFLRSFDTYLLERYPILWHSKVVYLVLTGILFWIAGFIAGYMLTDLPMLHKERIVDYYFDSYFVSFHAILCIITICIWAIYYFKKNAIRHYYPIKRLYFTRLLLCLLIGFLLPLSAYTPFTYGVRKKTLALIDGEQLEKDRQIINLASIFLPHYDGYDITDRSYPAPFPASTIEYDANEQTWDQQLLLNSDLDSNDAYDSYHPEDHPENTVIVDDRQYQFFQTKYIDRADGCTSDEVVQRFVHPDSALQLHQYGILNYSNTMIPRFAKRPERDLFGKRQYQLERTNQNESESEYNLDYAPVVYRWVMNDQKDSVQWIIRQLEKVCDRYAVLHTLDAHMIAAYLSEKNYHSFELYNVGSYYRYSSTKFCRKMLDKARHNMEKVLSYESTVVLRYESDKLERLYGNYEYALLEPQTEYTWYTYAGIALALTFIFLFFEFANFIQFLISIPAMGVLAIITGILMVLMECRPYYENQWKIPALFLCMTTLVLALGIAGSFMRWFNKRIAGILLNMGYAIAPFYYLLVIFLLDELTKYRTMGACGYNETNHTFWIHGYHPLGVFLGALLGILCYLRLVKVWYAREE